MGEAEKIDILPAAETPAASLAESERVSQPEAYVPEDIFVQLGALVNFDEFDLRGIIKRSRKIDKQIKKEMLDLADEARGKLAVFNASGFDVELAAEAAAYFDILMEMSEKHVSDFDKKLTEHNEKMEARRAAMEESQSVKPEEKVKDLDQAGQNNDPKEINNDDNKEAKKEVPLTNNKKNTMGKEGESLPSGSRTIKEQLAAKKDEIEKVIVPDRPADSKTEDLQKLKDGIREIIGDVATLAGTMGYAKEGPKNEAVSKVQAPVGGNAKKPKEDRIKIVDVAGNQRKVADERVAELGRKLAAAYKKSKSPKQEYESTKPVKDEIFDVINEQNPGWMKKNKRDGEERVRGEVVKVVEKTKDQFHGEEKDKKEKLENLKTQLEETYRIFYEDYSNKGKEVPVEMLKSLNDIKQDLFSVWPAWQKGGKGKQSSLGNFIEETKGKYRVEVKKEGKAKVAKIVENVDEKDLPKTELVVIEESPVVEKPIEKTVEKKIKPQPASPVSTHEGKSSVVAGGSFSSARNENQQEESKRIREELEKQKEEKSRFDNIQEHIKKGKATKAADATFAFDYAAREQKRIAEAEKKIAAQAETGAEKEKEKEKKDKKEIEKMLEPKKMEIFRKFGQDFYAKLKENASWEGYNKEDKFRTLEIQTRVFLSNQLKRRNLVGDNEMADVVDFLIKKINK